MAHSEYLRTSILIRSCSVYSGKASLSICSGKRDCSVSFLTDVLNSQHKVVILPTGPLKRRSDWQQAPHPRVKERVAALARSRQSGNTLFYSFLGGGGEEEKDVLEALISPNYRVALIT